MFLSFIYKAFFPEVPCFLPPNTKASFFIMIFFPLSWFPLSNWVTGYPLWQPWLHFSCYTLTPHASDFSDFCSGVLEVTSSCCAFLNHISGWAKSFLVVIDSSNQKHRYVVKSDTCCSTGTDINFSPWRFFTVLLMIPYWTFLHRLNIKSSCNWSVFNVQFLSTFIFSSLGYYPYQGFFFSFSVLSDKFVDRRCSTK